MTVLLGSSDPTSRGTEDPPAGPRGPAAPRHETALRVWRFAVVAYAAGLLGFVAWLKVGFVGQLALSPLLVGYGFLVAVYLGVRVVLAAFYRPDRTPLAEDALPTVMIAVPAFNEADHIEATIDALYRLDYPMDRLKVVVVDDGSSDGTWDRIQDCARRYPQLDGIRFSRNRGKRAAMAAAVRAADGADYVVFVDSDSVLDADALREIIRPFAGDADGAVAAVTGHADVLNPGANLLTRLQQVRYYAAFRIIKAAESRYGAVTCASGCFSAYRRSVLLEVLGEWESQRFLGREATFGDDRALTNALLRRGLSVRYQSTARSSTLVPDRWRVFWTQQLRWKKSWSRESLYVVRFAWRWPVLASFGLYASILFQLAGPLVAFHSILWRPLVGGGSPVLYLLGLHVVAVLYGLLYAGIKRSPHWWGGIAYAFVYAAVVSWQIYWAMATSRNTSWGTRDSDVSAAGDALAVAEVVGAPGPCGLPLLCDPGVRTDSVARRAPAGGVDTSDPVPTRGQWVVGLLALPVSVLPVVAWLVWMA